VGITGFVLLAAMGLLAQEAGKTASQAVPPVPTTQPTPPITPAVPNPFQAAPGDPHRDARETHLRHVRKLTNTGSNAEAYFSWDGKRIIYQSTREGRDCDQIYVMNSDGSDQHLASTGKGRTTCGYFLPGDKRIIYASTHGGGADCPPSPPFTPGTYRWPVFPSYDLYTAKPDGTDVKPLLAHDGYDAEATVAPNGKWLVFTSERSGDIDLWVADIDGNNLKRLTDAVGYDGGAVWSPDSKLIAWRTNYPKGEAATAKYRELLKQHLVEPMDMDIWVMNADGTGKRQLTHLLGAAFAPVFSPDGKSVVFSSNWEDREGKGRNFELYKVNLDGLGLERLTFTGNFNSFPHFSPDGKKLLWVSGREASAPRQFNVFLAEYH